MAIGVSVLTADGSTTDATSYTTASIAPAANALILAYVGNQDGVVTTPTASGNGLTYVQVVTVQGSGGMIRGTVFRAMGASPSSGAITISFGSATQSDCRWHVLEVTGVKTSGTNGSDAVVQSASSTSYASGGITVTLAAFADAVNNAAFGFFAHTAPASDITPGSGFTELADSGGGNLRCQSEWKLGEDTSVDATFADPFSELGLAIEVAAEVAGQPTTRRFGLTEIGREGASFRPTELGRAGGRIMRQIVPSVLSLDSYRRERAREHRAFMRKVRAA